MTLSDVWFSIVDKLVSISSKTIILVGYSLQTLDDKIKFRSELPTEIKHKNESLFEHNQCWINLVWIYEKEFQSVFKSQQNKSWNLYYLQTFFTSDDFELFIVFVWINLRPIRFSKPKPISRQKPKLGVYKTRSATTKPTGKNKLLAGIKGNIIKLRAYEKNDI